jgi:hypothetical protein
MGRQALDPGPVVADLHAPEMIDPVAVLDRLHGAPAVHPDRPIGERNGSELHAHPVHLRHERLDIERVHIPTPTNCPATRAPEIADGTLCDKLTGPPSRIAVPTRGYTYRPRAMNQCIHPVFPAVCQQHVTQWPQICRRPRIAIDRFQPWIEERRCHGISATVGTWDLRGSPADGYAGLKVILKGPGTVA